MCPTQFANALLQRCMVDTVKHMSEEEIFADSETLIISVF